MKIAAIFIAGFLFNSAQCYDSESLEYNGIEVSPLYETIIYSDIADILNEFDSSNGHFDKANNDSESDEDVEDLLTEYNHYLERAHKQRVNYLEKNSNKPKNKVPLVHHDKYTKMKSATAGKRKDHSKNNFYNSEHQFAQSLNPFNMFIPYNSNKYLSTSEQPVYNNDISAFKKMMMSDNGSPISAFSSIPVKPCCTDARPLCKQCMMHSDHMQQRTNPNLVLHSDEDKAFVSNNPSEQSDDTINIRIKVDVQLPKIQQDHVPFYNLQARDKMTDYDAGVSKEYLSAIKLPSPYFNFPIPMNLFGYKKMPKYNKHDTSPLHKITIHKKKKPKTGNGNKKHRKKVITFHNVKIEPELYQTHFGMFNISENLKNETEINNTVVLNLQNSKTKVLEENLTTNHLNENVNFTEPQNEENILLSVNITNNIENGTNEQHKTENSIETEFTNVISNATTDQPLHLLHKREIPSQNISTTNQNKPKKPPKKEVAPQKQSTTPQTKSTTSKTKLYTAKKKTNNPLKKSIIKKKPLAKNKTMPYVKKNSTEQRTVRRTVVKLDKEKSSIAKVNKSLASDAELLYWPNNYVTISKDILKNITAIILESENKKAKLNMTKDTLRRNHTRALEQAIFGNVDWNDVDQVAPAFISFVGKYIEGILTFCNERICHSMKCSKKHCLHRVCAPKDRFNNKGHCIGSHSTDSVASMESIMDLPSNIAFEIVDILQDRMIRKLFGKITVCINFKCITFAASKNVFYKTKCTVKELNPKSHCVHSKDAKVA